MTLHLLLASIGVRCFPPDEAPDLCCRRRAAGRTLLACSSPTQIGWVRTHCCPESPQRKHLSSAPCKSAPNGALDSPIGTLGALIHEPPRVHRAHWLGTPLRGHTACWECCTPLISPGFRLIDPVFTPQTRGCVASWSLGPWAPCSGRRCCWQRSRCMRWANPDTTAGSRAPTSGPRCGRNTTPFQQVPCWPWSYKSSGHPDGM